MWGNLSQDMQRVAKLVGVEEAYLGRAARGSYMKDVRMKAILFILLDFLNFNVLSLLNLLPHTYN